MSGLSIYILCLALETRFAPQEPVFWHPDQASAAIPLLPATALFRDIDHPAPSPEASQTRSALVLIHTAFTVPGQGQVLRLTFLADYAYRHLFPFHRISADLNIKPYDQGFSTTILRHRRLAVPLADASGWSAPADRKRNLRLERSVRSPCRGQ